LHAAQTGQGPETVVGPAAPPGLVLSDAVVITMDAERRCFESGYVWIGGDRIQAVGPMSELPRRPTGATVRSMKGRLIMPGLVNCHTHLSNGILRGLYDEMPLEVWFSKGMWPVLTALDSSAGKAGAKLALLELMTTGVTTTACGDFGTPNEDLLDGVLSALMRSGMRAVASRITVDSADETSPSQFIPAEFRERPERAVSEVRRLRRMWGSGRISIVPEALGVLRCTREMVEAMHDLAVREDIHFLMHAASSPEERDESLRRFGHGTIKQLAELGALGPKTLLAHCVWLTDEEIGLLSENGTGVSHNPVSNAYYASGEARLAELLAKNVRIGLGVDGASTNNSQNLWETAKMTLLYQKQRLHDASFGSAELALELLTIGGARALHMEDEIGSLEPGKRADLIAIDFGRAALSPRQTLVSSLIYSNDPAAVRNVFVDGEELVRDGVHVNLPLDEAVGEAQEAAARLLRQSGLDEYIATRGRWRWQA
jgi:5-methylthioadenosine/S-adenosylhomocysteine deaminase